MPSSSMMTGSEACNFAVFFSGERGHRAYIILTYACQFLIIGGGKIKKENISRRQKKLVNGKTAVDRCFSSLCFWRALGQIMRNAKMERGAYEPVTCLAVVGLVTAAAAAVGRSWRPFALKLCCPVGPRLARLVRPYSSKSIVVGTALAPVVSLFPVPGRLRDSRSGVSVCSWQAVRPYALPSHFVPSRAYHVDSSCLGRQCHTREGSDRMAGEL